MLTLSLLYVRVSSKEQEKEGYSLDAQEKLGHEYAQRKGFKIVKQWKVSESAWDRKKDRVAFNQMVEYARTHPEIEHIIFDILDRMTRNDFDKLKIYDLVQYHNKTIHFSRSNKIYNRNSTPDDLFMLDIEVAVAKKMSNDISRKTQMGMVEKAEQGKFPSTAPLGYKNNKTTHLLEVNEEQADHIKKAFRLMATGQYSLKMLAQELYKNGFRTNRSKIVHKTTLDYLLKNTFYYGPFHWKGKVYQGNHEPLITKELFDKVQEVSKGNFHVCTNKRGFAFNNLAVCGICGCKVLGEEKVKPSGRKYIYYHCTFSRGRHNDVGYVPENELAKKFEESLNKIRLNEDTALWLKEALRINRTDTLKSQENHLRALKSQEEKVKTRLNNLYDLRIDKSLGEETFKTKENEYKNSLIEIQAGIEQAEKINPHFYEDGLKILELCNLLPEQYLKANYHEKAKILKLVASNYTLNAVSPTAAYKKPFSFFAEMKGCPNKLPR